MGHGNCGFGRGETRPSALWGSGTAGGDRRRRGRKARVLLAPLVAVAAITPLSASAFDRSAQPATYVDPSLTTAAGAHPQGSLHVIVQSDAGSAGARQAVQAVGADARRLPIADAVAADVSGSDLATLRNVGGLTITPDAAVHEDGGVSVSKQLWPYAAGASALWSPTAALLGKRDTTVAPPTIAVVDSGIDAARDDFTTGRRSRVLRQVTMTTLTPNSPVDGRGHGTFVAALAAGDGRDYAGAAPSANLLSLDVMDDQGTARTSDVIAAANWILAHKDEYNIRVANLSLHSSVPSSFTRDPLDKAVERLWLNGITVVTAAGNYGSAGQPTRVRYAPGNDPFVITVGALDLKGSLRASDHTVAPWSAYGYTYDGFAKPELAAPGRFMIAAIPPSSSLAQQNPGQMVGPDHIELSGTSFSAAVVSGIAADLLALHPAWTPDQVKGALMLTARPDRKAPPLSAGVGEVNALFAAFVAAPPNPNLALERFVKPDAEDDGRPTFDSASWTAAVQGSVSWDQSTWADSAWSSVSWLQNAWADVSWDQVSYDDVSYDEVSYDDVSYDAVSYEDAALADFLRGGYPAP